MKIVLYTDGAAVPNPGHGGAGIVMLALADDGVTVLKERAFGVYLGAHWTNNAAEITAAIKALAELTQPTACEIRSDSQYLINTMSKGWARNKNAEHWHLLDGYAAKHAVTWTWVKGHAGDRYNELADELANGAIAARGNVLRKAA